MRLSCARIRIRSYATLPTSGRHPISVGECSANKKTQILRNIRLAPSINTIITPVDDLRSEFLSFFKNLNHSIVSPSSVYPKRQEGSYFVNSGMNQFKPLFFQENKEKSMFTNLSRAANSQPCIRIGGRQDDLNDVGYDTCHHTMFEMLGNWSFGDYGKETACKQMWQFLRHVLGLPANSLYVSFFGGCSKLGLPSDDETRDIWLSLGVSDQKLIPFGSDHNFWKADQHSGAGLCGPSTEIHVDYQALSGVPDLRCARCLVNSGDPQVVELWNCVFITHQLIESSNSQMQLKPIPKLCIDTGMGLERLASVMQGTMSTYDTDAFAPLLAFITSESMHSSNVSDSHYGSYFQSPNEQNTLCQVDQTLSNLTDISDKVKSLFEKRKEPTEEYFDLTDQIKSYHSLHRDVAYRLLADHGRALIVALQDGLLPGRQGLPLKLRHLIFRATRAAVLTDIDSPENPKLLSKLVREFSSQFPHFYAFDLEGPSGRKPSALSPDQMYNIIINETKPFIPRLMKMEESFNRCVLENESVGVLSAKQVSGLQLGQFGEPVSWDMLCAQARWYGYRLSASSVPSPTGSSTRRSQTSKKKNRPFKVSIPKIHLRRSSSFTQLSNSGIEFTDDLPKYNYDRKASTTDNDIVYSQYFRHF